MTETAASMPPQSKMGGSYVEEAFSLFLQRLGCCKERARARVHMLFAPFGDGPVWTVNPGFPLVTRGYSRAAPPGPKHRKAARREQGVRSVAVACPQCGCRVPAVPQSGTERTVLRRGTGSHCRPHHGMQHQQLPAMGACTRGFANPGRTRCAPSCSASLRDWERRHPCRPSSQNSRQGCRRSQ